MIAERLHLALKAALPGIVGVSLGREDDKSTWTVQPLTLQAAAQPIIDAFVIPTAQQLADEDAVRETSDKKLKAVALALYENWPNPLMTKAQLQARILTIYKGL